MLIVFNTVDQINRVLRLGFKYLDSEFEDINNYDYDYILMKFFMIRINYNRYISYRTY